MTNTKVGARSYSRRDFVVLHSATGTGVFGKLVLEREGGVDRTHDVQVLGVLRDAFRPAGAGHLLQGLQRMVGA